MSVSVMLFKKVSLRLPVTKYTGYRAEDRVPKSEQGKKKKVETKR